jgi:hypothetical protein
MKVLKKLAMTIDLHELSCAIKMFGKVTLYMGRNVMIMLQCYQLGSSVRFKNYLHCDRVMNTYD